MTLEYILKRLDDCAEHNCFQCDLKCVPAMLCQEKMIKKVRGYLREYLETQQDDKK